MIQRKQTLFLLIIFGLLLTMVFANLAVATSHVADQTTTTVDGVINKTTVLAQNTLVFNVWGVHTDGEAFVSFPYFASLVIAVATLALLAIFFYRKRMIQIRLCYVIGILLIGIMAFQGLYYYRLVELTSAYPAMQYTIVPSLINAFSLISLIFLWLAYKGIVKDEALVRSLDRIR